MHNANKTGIFSIKQLTRGALIAALYTALSLTMAPISMGTSGIDLRFAEAMTLLPVLFPEAVPGLFVGCLLTNVLGGGSIWDIVFGSLATLLAAICTYRLRKIPSLSRMLPIAAVPPVLFNALIVGAVLHFSFWQTIPLISCMLIVGAGQAIICYLLGIPLVLLLRRLPKHVFNR